MQRNEIVILGAGESGIGAALLAISLKENVFVSDAGLIKEKYKSELINNGIDFEESGHNFDRLIEAKIAIVSPGIPDSAKPLKVLLEKGIEVISEIEYGYRNTDATIIAITGSNGKTTTTGLIHNIMINAKYNVAVGGNYGVSMCRILSNRKPKYLVLELSSFQLERVVDFRAHIAILLNITPDHLDRYQNDINLYGNAKFNIVNNQIEKDIVIYNGDDNYIQNNLNARILPSTRRICLSTKDYIQGLASYDANLVFKTSLKGIHNLFNASCAIAACRELGLSEQQIASGLETFSNMSHRMESVAVLNGVQYINDSKATNVDAVYYALEAMNGPIVWIAGGVDKGNDYSVIKKLVKDKVKALICLTKFPKLLTKPFGELIDDITITEDINEAVLLATIKSQKGDTVLFSPACASFDLFKNYEDRGDQFKNEVIKKLNIAINSI